MTRVRRAEPARLEVQKDYRRPLAEALTERLGHPAVATVFPGNSRAGEARPLLHLTRPG